LVQLSATVVSQATQVPPFPPQAEGDGGVWHVEPVQQPEVHVCEQPMHTCPTQVLVPQSAQALPAPPHWVLLVPIWQTSLLSQQPFGQLVALQTHEPFTQARPEPHWRCVPHMQWPVALQESDCVRLHVVHAPPPTPHVAWDCVLQVVPLQHPPGHEVASHWHDPFLHSWPAPQAVFPPQLHVPPVHPSASCVLHVVHAPPPPPHPGKAGMLHALLASQHPVGHEVESHTHDPPEQC